MSDFSAVREPRALFLSIVIPAYNEEIRLPSTLQRIVEYLAGNAFGQYEIIVVDDGSRDGTASFVEECAKKNPSVRLVRNPGNRGKGYSVRHGMLSAQGEWVLFTDADLSAPIQELAKLLAAVKGSRADIAIGSRALDRSLVTVHQSTFRELSGRVFNLVVRLISGLAFKDTQCGFKLYHCEAVKQVFPLQQLDGFSFDVEDLYIARIRGCRVVEVPVQWANVEGTKVSATAGLRSFADVLRVRWYAMQGRYDSSSAQAHAVR